LSPDTTRSIRVNIRHYNQQYPKQVKDRLSGQDQSDYIGNYYLFIVSRNRD